MQCKTTHVDTIRDPDIMKKLEQQRIPTSNQLTLQDMASGKWKRDPVQAFIDEPYQAFMLDWIVVANKLVVPADDSHSKPQSPPDIRRYD
ncbi:hypothetical protein M427DRAFT_30966 [Gonapodya prolifera JEL478]|uniref:Uncharacterized protein n=1 Tax=Gonapodya prolifera (strain JEL478) TaxID=1344416 RepID=A0A139AK26_GONPJ|nr:hypothetical protein M427DRAFT_30966 [Gonapodya prolifera JEL478]|eukprot:KXS16863.1 hypothetical protein M427DRAFT_30966 [Gonapodya prolifera JEL478]